MAERDIRRIESMAQRGNTEAALILELMAKCKQVASGESLDDITLAMGIRSERDHDEMLAGVMEDMLNELMPTILKMTYSGMPGNFFDGLSFHVSLTMRLDVAIFAFHRWNKTWPATVTLSNQWKEAMQGASTYTYRDGDEEHTIKLKYIKCNMEWIECNPGEATK